MPFIFYTKWNDITDRGICDNAMKSLTYKQAVQTKTDPLTTIVEIEKTILAFGVLIDFILKCNILHLKPRIFEMVICLA